MDQMMIDLNVKMDALAAQVAYLTEQAQISEQQRQGRAELMQDLTVVADEAFRLSIGQLEEIQDYIDLSDLFRLFKRILRNGRNLETMLDQLESLMDLITTLSQIGDETFCKLVNSLATLEHKGYFRVAKSGLQIADNFVTSLTEEDIKYISENANLIIDIAKDFSKPEFGDFVRDTYTRAQSELKKPVDESLIGMLRQMRDPAIRRGLILTLRLLKVIGEQASNAKNIEFTSTIEK